MKCPECLLEMTEVKTSSHYGNAVVLDQCNKCGGLWLDELELYRAKLGVAQEIEKELDVQKLRKFTTFEHQSLFCPKDNSQLKLLRDYNFPKNIQVEICPKCRGFWFNYGEFSQFQNERIKNSKIREETIDEKNKREQLNKELGDKIISALKLSHEFEAEKIKENDRKVVESIIYIIWLLIRIFLGRR